MERKEEAEWLFQEDDISSTQEHHPPANRPASRYKHYAILSTILLTISLLLNLYLILSNIGFFDAASHHHKPQDHSLYADLPTDMMLPWTDTTDYTSKNLTLADEMFKTLSADEGVIALPIEWAKEKGLPISTGLFPWDKNKRMYVVNGYHSIHCIQQLHLSFREYRDGLPQSHHFEHNNHCLDWLRNDIICRADDTPLFTDNTRQSRNGIGQNRQCRDWSKLEAWTKKYHSCFRYGNFVEAEKLSQLERFKYCPDDSPYLPKVRKYYGKSDDWFPAHLPKEYV